MAERRRTVVDLFCGGGGFSEGARLAGWSVALAVDSDPDVLGVHRANHPSTVHVCATLPCDEVDALVERHARDDAAHVHASPPCQNVSQANRRASTDAVDASLRLVTWYVERMVALRPASWTMEQVNAPSVRCALEEIRRRRPDAVDFVVVDAADFGVPQHRRRLIVGPPWLIERLRRCAPVDPVVSVRDVLPDAPGTHVQSTTTNTPCRRGGDATHRPLRPDEHLRDTDGASYTILARQPPWWANAAGDRVRRLTPRECAQIQSFPPEYDLSTVTNAVAQRAIGNAVPPRLAARVLALAAEGSPHPEASSRRSRNARTARRA